MRVRPDLRLAGAAVLVSLPYFVNTLAHSVYARIDTAWLALLCDAQEVGWYGAGLNLAAIALLGMPLLGWVAVPGMARAAAEGPEDLDAFSAGTLRLTLLGAVPLALAVGVGAPLALRLLFGEPFLPAAPALRILAPTFALTYISTVVALDRIQRGRIWTVAAISIAGIGVTAALDAWLIPLGAAAYGSGGGAQGAAWATLSTELLVLAALALPGWRLWRDRALRRTALGLLLGVAAALAVVSLVPLRDGALGAEALRVLLAGLVFAAVALASGAVGVADVRMLRAALGSQRGAGPSGTPSAR